MTVKYGKKKHKNINIKSSDSFDDITEIIFSLTGLPPQVQKIIVRGKKLQNDDDVKRLIKNRVLITVMGSQRRPTSMKNTRIKFVEDMACEKQAAFCQESSYKYCYLERQNKDKLEIKSRFIVSMSNVNMNWKDIAKQYGLHDSGIAQLLKLQDLDNVHVAIRHRKESGLIVANFVIRSVQQTEECIHSAKISIEEAVDLVKSALPEQVEMEMHLCRVDGCQELVIRDTEGYCSRHRAQKYHKMTTKKRQIAKKKELEAKKQKEIQLQSMYINDMGESLIDLRDYQVSSHQQQHHQYQQHHNQQFFTVNEPEIHHSRGLSAAAARAKKLRNKNNQNNNNDYIRNKPSRHRTHPNHGIHHRSKQEILLESTDNENIRDSMAKIFDAFEQAEDNLDSRIDSNNMDMSSLDEMLNNDNRDGEAVLMEEENDALIQQLNSKVSLLKSGAYNLSQMIKDDAMQLNDIENSMDNATSNNTKPYAANFMNVMNAMNTNGINMTISNINKNMSNQQLQMTNNGNVNNMNNMNSEMVPLPPLNHCVHVTFDRDSADSNGLKETDFKQQFQIYGVINKISLPRYSDQGLKGYAFIHFEENNNGLS